MYDAIVIGARCAGAATAMLLARAGARVLLVDRGEPWSEVPRGHFIHRHGPARLARWGLLDRVLATGCPPVTRSTMDYGDFALTGGELAVDGVPMGLGPRRSRLDAVLADAAVEAGAELRTRFAVSSLAWDGDRVTGVRGRHHGGLEVLETASLVIGADGRNSLVAAQAGAAERDVVPPISCWYFSYWSGVADDALEITVRDRRATFAFPTNDGLYALFVAWPAEELPRVRADIEGSVRDVVARVPALADRMAGATREERFRGATQLPNFLRDCAGPGWALVGDAGCHKDPFLALGICDALRDAELLAAAIGRGALHEYQAERDAATRPGYEQNLVAARLEPPAPEHARLRTALRGNPAETTWFFLAVEGMVDPAPFFAESHLRELIRQG